MNPVNFSSDDEYKPGQRYPKTVFSSHAYGAKAGAGAGAGSGAGVKGDRLRTFRKRRFSPPVYFPTPLNRFVGSKGERRLNPGSPTLKEQREMSPEVFLKYKGAKRTRVDKANGFISTDDSGSDIDTGSKFQANSLVVNLVFTSDEESDVEAVTSTRAGFKPISPAVPNPSVGGVFDDESSEEELVCIVTKTKP